MKTFTEDSENGLLLLFISKNVVDEKEEDISK